MHAEFDHYIEPTTCNGERRVSVTYKTPAKWGKKGDWLEKYCVKRETYYGPSVASQLHDKVDYAGIAARVEGDFESKIKPVKSKFVEEQYKPDKLRGANVPSKRSNTVTLDEMDYNDLEKRALAHCAGDKPDHDWIHYPYGPESMPDSSQSATEHWSDKTNDPFKLTPEQRAMWDSITEYHRIKPMSLTTKNELFRKLYSGYFDKVDPVISGTKIHKLIEDELAEFNPNSISVKTDKQQRIDWLSKHDDFVDASIYMHVDYAKGFNPNINPENTMKATIKELYVDGVLTQTLINDHDLNTMSSSDLLNQIGNVEAGIEKLTKHNGAKSKFIGQEMKRLTQFVDSVYLLLDEKFATKTEVTFEK